MPDPSTPAAHDAPRSPGQALGAGASDVVLEGRRVPDVPVQLVTPGGGARPVGSGTLFAGRRVVAFALPGAFTPTCSAQHLPRYEELAPAFRAAGVDAILCMSVNDPYVMAEWGRTQGVAEVELVADGNGDFAEGMGLLVDRHEVGFGRRSRRYSMLVDDGVVRRAFVEPDAPGDPFEVSDADTMLASVAPDAARPPHVAMIAKAGCPHCARAADRLREARVPFVEIVLPDAVRGRALQALAGATTAPQVFVDGRLVGGSDALEEWLRRRPAPG